MTLGIPSVINADKCGVLEFQQVLHVANQISIFLASDKAYL